MKFKKIFNDLEFNKSTEDVDLDIKHLQIGDNIKAILFYAITVGFSGYLAFSIYDSVAKDSFKSELIKIGIPPLITYFYKDYSKDDDFKKKIDSKIAEINNELEKLKSFQKSENFSYSAFDFGKEVENGTVKIAPTDFLKEWEQFKTDYYYSVLTKNKMESISIGDNEYPINTISNKLSSLSEDEAREQAELPINALIEKFNLDKNDKEIIFTAIYTLNTISYNLSRFYNGLDIDLDFDKYFISPIKQGNSYIALNSNVGSSRKVDISSSLNALINKRTEIKKAEYEKSKAEYEKSKAENNAKIKKLEDDRKSLNQIIILVNEIGRDISKYSENKEKIEILEESVEWTSK